MSDYHRFEIAQSRPDIVREDNPKLAEAIKLKRDALQDALRTGDITHDDKRLIVRRTLIESNIG
jgi:hypothetical protein